MTSRRRTCAAACQAGDAGGPQPRPTPQSRRAIVFGRRIKAAAGCWVRQTEWCATKGELQAGCLSARVLMSPGRRSVQPISVQTPVAPPTPAARGLPPLPRLEPKQTPLDVTYPECRKLGVLRGSG